MTEPSRSRSTGDAPYPRLPGAAWGPQLSAAAERYRDHLGLPLRVLPTPRELPVLLERSGGLARTVAGWLAETRDGRPLPCALWSRDELRRLARCGPGELAEEWRRRVRDHSFWGPLHRNLRRGCDHAAAWTSLPGGDFDVDGRGEDYTSGIGAFHAARWSGSQALLRLMGALTGGERAAAGGAINGGAGGGTYLDVLGGDGYLWRILRAEASRENHRPGPRLVTNDCSRHMFLQAGAWGLPTREEATRLQRTFAPGTFDGVLFAYGTHHVENLEAAVAAASGLLGAGGSVVLHDFLDEGPVGTWFHRVVDPYSKTGHDLPHNGPVQMAVALLLAGLREVELYEMADPFVFPRLDGCPAHDLALGYLAGMYGLRAEVADRPRALRRLVGSTLVYPELDDRPVFEADRAYVPRRAVVARARRPASSDAPLGAGDRRLVDRLSELLSRSPASFAEMGPETLRWWFADGRRWGVDEATRRRFLSWIAA